MIELPDDPAIQALLLTEALATKAECNQLQLYKPHKKQLKAHALSLFNILCAVFGGNRTGKSVCAGVETTYHLIGEYPGWWTGRKLLKRPVKWWVGSKTFELTRDGAQRLLLGPPGRWGTGLIPKDKIKSISRRSGSVKDAVDIVMIKHSSGGVSELKFKAYDQGREAWQAVALDGAWLDEEPDIDIMKEAQMRVFDRKGYLLLAFTPLKGMSDVCLMFLGTDKKPKTGFVNFSWADNPHLSPESIADLEAQMLPHELEARQHGRPTVGAGVVYPVTDESILCDPFQIPEYWPRGFGLDVGFSHPTAACWMAHDRQNDTVYAYDEYRMAGQDPTYHAAGMRLRGKIPGFSDPAAKQSSQIDGQKILDRYRAEGLDLSLADNAVRDGIFEIFSRMKTSRFKVFSTCVLFMEEKRIYHRNEKGVIVKEREDLMDACRYGMSGIAQWRTIQNEVVNRPRNRGGNVDPMFGGS